MSKKYKPVVLAVLDGFKSVKTRTSDILPVNFRATP